LDPEKTTKIVLATCCLHNYLLSRKAYSYAPSGTFGREEQSGLIPGSWREEGTPQNTLHSIHKEMQVLLLRKYVKSSKLTFIGGNWGGLEGS
jgi:hypothetical protein